MSLIVVVINFVLVAAADPFTGLLRWLRDDCGAVLAPDLALTASGIRGVVTHSALAANDPIALVPRKCLLLNSMARAHPYALGVYDLEDPYAVYLAMVLYVMHARAEPDHFFQPYFRTFPADMSNFPLFWTAAQLALLPPTTRDTVTQEQANVRRSWQACVRLAPPARQLGERFSFDEFREAYALVTSRSFSVYRPTADDPKAHYSTLAMIPLADLLNHGTAHKNADWSWAPPLPALMVEEHVQLSATSSVRAGAELQDSYGTHSQALLLATWGFTLLCGRGGGGERSVDDDIVHQRLCIDELVFSLDGALTTLRYPLASGTFATVVRESEMREALRRASGIPLGSKRKGVQLVPWRVRKLVARATANYPLGLRAARVRLMHATLRSPEFNALNLLVGELSVAAAWIEKSLEADAVVAAAIQYRARLQHCDEDERSAGFCRLRRRTSAAYTGICWMCFG